MVLASLERLPGQPQTKAAEADVLKKSPSALSERHRKRKLSANERALEEFFLHNLPPGWNFAFRDRLLSLERVAPVYILPQSDEEVSLLSKAALLSLARRTGTKIRCRIELLAERHDDTAIVRQKIRLYKEIRRDTEQAYHRLNLRHLCGSTPAAECAIGTGQAAEAAREYLVTRQILIDKLEVTPFYRIGTLYLYPKKNQCVPAKNDWYLANTLVPEKTQFLPLEAREEVEITLRNLEQLKLWE